MENSFSMDLGREWFQVDSSHDIYRALFSIFPTQAPPSDHQALQPGGWGPCSK